MKFEQMGREIRRARIGRNFTQAQLADRSGITRTTLNQVENGSVRDLGIRKIEAVLNHLGLELELRDVSAIPQPTNFLRMASTSASVSFKDALTEKDLLQALMTGKVPAGRRPHLRMLIEEAPRELLQGLMNQVEPWTSPGKVAKNLGKISDALGIDAKANQRWRKI